MTEATKQQIVQHPGAGRSPSISQGMPGAFSIVNSSLPHKLVLRVFSEVSLQTASHQGAQLDIQKV